MTTLRREVLLRAPIEAVWGAVRDIGALHTRLVPGFVVDTQLVEDGRIVTFANGMIVHEPIIDIDEERHRICWTALGAPLTHYNASFELYAEGEMTRGVWIADLLPHEAADFVAPMMQEGLSAMTRAFGDGSQSATK